MRTVLTTTLTVVAIVVVLYLIYLLRKPIAWLVLATFIAVAVSGPVNWLNRRMRRSRAIDRKSTRLNSSHANISYAVFCLKKKSADIAASLKSFEELIAFARGN